MLQQFIMAIGAGIASAVLFVVPANGSLLAVVFGLVAPLPLLIVAIGQGERLGALAFALGLAATAIGFNPMVGGVYALTVGAPALMLAFLVRRPSLGSPGQLLLACVVLSTLIAFAGIAVEAFTYSSLDAALDDMVDRLTPMAQSMISAADGVFGGMEPKDFARVFALAIMPTAAAWGVVGLAANLWLAARVSGISGQLNRQWPDIPTTLRLPRLAFIVLGVCLALCLAPGVTRLLAASAVAALLVGFSFHGLATLHGVTRGRAGRPAILGGFYALSLTLFPWPLFIIAGLGLADLARPLRRAAAVSQPPSKTN